MPQPAETTGANVRLRPVVPQDAAFIHGLRVDPAYNAHLSPVTGTAADQRDWILRYKEREAAGQEIYFVIERLDGTPCGTVRLYDITVDSFTWGSWILNEDKPPKAALESALLLYDIGFEVLDKSRSVFDVRADNERTLNFHLRFGAEETGSDSKNIYFELTRKKFLILRQGLWKNINPHGSA
jgi:RimJ/RimL family protein N-acetyltransferase